MKVLDYNPLLSSEYIPKLNKLMKIFEENSKEKDRTIKLFFFQFDNLNHK